MKVGVLFIVFAAFLGCNPDANSEAARSAEVGSADESIVNGSATKDFDQVVAISERRVACDRDLNAFCSGTLIGDDAVLTAAHCFTESPPGLSFEVFIGDDVAEGGEIVGVLSVDVHPNFDDVTRAHDIAVLRLAKKIEGVVPAALPTSAPPTELLLASVEMVGFGATSGSSAPDGLKRVGQGEVLAVGEETVDVSPSPSLTCQGDSGGPLFDVADTSEAGVVIAVTSSGDPACTMTNVFSLVWPSVDDFIAPALAKVVTERPASADICASACDEDAECPLGWVCTASMRMGMGPGDKRCALPGLLAGSLDSTCFTVVDCDNGSCVRADADSCRCYSACDSIGPEPPKNGSGGCGLIAGKPTQNTIFVFVAVWLFLVPRRVSRKNVGAQVV